MHPVAIVRSLGEECSYEDRNIKEMGVPLWAIEAHYEGPRLSLEDL